MLNIYGGFLEALQQCQTWGTKHQALLGSSENLDVRVVLLLLDFSIAKCQYLPQKYQNLFPFFLAIMNVSFSITINLKNQCHHKPFYFPDSSEHLSGHHFCSPSWHSITFFYVCKYNARYTSGFYFFFFFFLLRILS